jgi:DNA-binding transcriptional LysR family regulator
MQKAGLVDLNAVVAVAATRNFRAAALELGMSASALSHAISTLETRIGVRLFNRTTRSVSLTEAGEEFIGRISPALRDISEAMEAVNAFRASPTGTIRINTSESAARGLLVPIVIEFQKRYPDVHVDVVTDGRMVDIAADGYDAGIRLLDNVPPDMVAIALRGDERFAVVASPAYLAKHERPRTPQDLLTHPCIRLRLPSGTVYRWEFEKHGQEIRLDVKGPMTLQSPEMIMEAVLDGAGIGYMLQRNLKEAIAKGRLVHLLQDWTPPFPGICFYYPRHRQVPAGLKTFIAVLREMVGRRGE